MRVEISCDVLVLENVVRYAALYQPLVEYRRDVTRVHARAEKDDLYISVDGKIGEKARAMILSFPEKAAEVVHALSGFIKPVVWLRAEAVIKSEVAILKDLEKEIREKGLFSKAYNLMVRPRELTVSFDGTNYVIRIEGYVTVDNLDTLLTVAEEVEAAARSIAERAKAEKAA